MNRTPVALVTAALVCRGGGFFWQGLRDPAVGLGWHVPPASKAFEALRRCDQQNNGGAATGLGLSDRASEASSNRLAGAREGSRLACDQWRRSPPSG